MGKLIVTRFNRATAGIEAFNVVVPRMNVAGDGDVNGGVLTWEGREDEGWMLRSYMPDLRLWYNDPVLVIDSDSTKTARRLAQTNRHRKEELHHQSAEEELRMAETDWERMDTIPWRGRGITMEIGTQPSVRNILRLALRADSPLVKKTVDDDEDSLSVWPPRTIQVRSPSQRVCNALYYQTPQTLSSLSTYGFHLSRCISFAPELGFPLGGVGVGMNLDATYATLDEELYIPTQKKPLQGVWVGDYSGHGSEFLLFVHRDARDTFQGIPHADDKDRPPRCSIVPSTNNNNHINSSLFSSDYLDIPSGSPTTTTTSNAATPSSSPSRSRSTPISILPASPSPHVPSTLPPIPLPSNGSLHAIKLTGDPNIPRGEVSFVIPDLSPATGLIRIATESPFAGAPVFRGKGHIARTGFSNCECIDIEVIIVSVNVIAVVWIDMRVVAYFRRVDIQELWER